MEQETNTMTNYRIDEHFEEKLNSFFQELGLAPLYIELAVLQSVDYDRLIEKGSMASLRQEDQAKKSTSLTIDSNRSASFAAQPRRYKVYVREENGLVNLREVIAAFLQVNFPEYNKERVVPVAETFEEAFRCYNRLYEETKLRNFFMTLCRNSDSLFKMANILVR